MRSFAGLPQAVLQDASTAACAPKWAQNELDFAYPLHLAAARVHEGYSSVDRALARTSREVAAPEAPEP